MSKETSIVEIDLSKVHTDRRPNIRITEERDDLRQLESSRRKHGDVAPPVVIACGDDTYDVIAGFGRLASIKLQPNVKSAKFVLSTTDDPEALMVAENVARKDLAWYEIALGIRNVIRKTPDASGREIAAKCGMRESSVSKYRAIIFSDTYGEELEASDALAEIPGPDESLLDAVIALVKGGPGNVVPSLGEIYRFATCDWAQWREIVKAEPPTFGEWCASGNLAFDYFATDNWVKEEESDDGGEAGSDSGSDGGEVGGTGVQSVGQKAQSRKVMEQYLAKMRKVPASKKSDELKLAIKLLAWACGEAKTLPKLEGFTLDEEKE